jgi:hypothetical protein
MPTLTIKLKNDIKYNLIVGKNRTGKTKFLNKLENTIDIFEFHLINWNTTKRKLYDELLKKHDVRVTFPQPNGYVNSEKIQDKINTIEETAQPIIERISDLKSQSFNVDPLLHIHESIYACLMNTLEQKSCVVCDNQHTDLDELVEKYRELGKYIEQQHTNLKNSIDYKNLKLQYEDLKSDHSFQTSFLKQIEKHTRENKHQSMFDDFTNKISTSMKEYCEIEDMKIEVDRGNRKIHIGCELSRTERIYLSFILANYLYDDKIIIFDDIGLDSDNLKELIKFIHDKKYNNEIYITSLIKPKGRMFQDWNTIELGQENKEDEETI